MNQVMISDFFTDNVDCFCVPGWALVQESDGSVLTGNESFSDVNRYSPVPDSRGGVGMGWGLVVRGGLRIRGE